jgi:ankyrin repeat protein
MKPTFLATLIVGGLLAPTIGAFDNNSDLIKAAKKGQTDKVVALLAKGADPNAKDKDGSALLQALDNNHPETADALLAKGADINAVRSDGYTAFLAACSRCLEPYVKRLLEKRVDVKVRTNSGAGALWFAAKTCSASIVETLIASGADPNLMHTGQDLIIAPVAGNSLETVKLLLARNADVNAKTQDGKSVMRPLIAGFERLNLFQAEGGQTPLMRAALNHQAAAVGALLAHGAEVNTRNSIGATSLIYAVTINGNNSVAELTGGRATALMLAAGTGQVEVVQALIAGGADVNAVSEKGETALKLATQFFDARIITLLKDAGARE